MVVGDGRMRDAVESAGGSNVEILGHVDDDTLLDLYRRCQALLFPGEEDFGIIPVEAQACGAPVLARGVGGVRDSVIPGTTGILYPAVDGRGEVDALASAMRSFDATSFDAGVLRAHAEGFGPDAFRARFQAAIKPLIERWGDPVPAVSPFARPSAAS